MTSTAMKPMSVLVLGIRGIPGVQGGIETHAEQLYPRLAALGCRVEALVRTPFTPREPRFFGAIKLRRLWSPKREGFETFIHSVIGVLYAGCVRPDILHIHGIGPAIVTPVARLIGLRVVVTHHGRDYEREKWGPFARWVLRVGERAGMRWANARIAISSTIANTVLERYRRDCYLIPNGVVAAQPRADTQYVRDLGLEPGRYVLQVSRMVPEKRQLDLIRAYASARLRGWKLALAGALDDGDYSRKVRACAQDQGVVLTGYVSGEPLQQLYSHAGAFVLPSSHEGLPIALLEALSYGLPVLASDIPANLEVGLDRLSYVPLGDTAALASRLSEISESPMSESARLARRLWTMQKYDWDRIAAQTLQVYRNVMATQANPSSHEASRANPGSRSDASESE
jgi:glycosyltransferase involved in cell wall biosynthesis